MIKIFLALIIAFGTYQYFSDVHSYKNMSQKNISYPTDIESTTETFTPEINIDKPTKKFIPQKGKTLSFEKPSSYTNPNALRKPKTKSKPTFKCDSRIHCSQMHSYEEAKFFLRHCPGVKMDGDRDGIPCERQFGRYD